MRRSNMMVLPKQSSRAPFITRRDTVKLTHKKVNVSGSRQNKVAVPPSSPQLTAIKLVLMNKKEINFINMSAKNTRINELAL